MQNMYKYTFWPNFDPLEKLSKSILSINWELGEILHGHLSAQIILTTSIIVATSTWATSHCLRCRDCSSEWESRTDKILGCLDFLLLLYSWFTGQRGSKSADKQSENCQTWGFRLSLVRVATGKWQPAAAMLLATLSISPRKEGKTRLIFSPDDGEVRYPTGHLTQRTRPISTRQIHDPSTKIGPVQ